MQVVVLFSALHTCRGPARPQDLIYLTFSLLTAGFSIPGLVFTKFSNELATRAPAYTGCQVALLAWSAGLTVNQSLESFRYLASRLLPTNHTLVVRARLNALLVQLCAIP